MSSQDQKRSFVLGIITGLGIMVILGGVYMLGRSSGDGGSLVANTGAGAGAPTQPSAAPAGDPSADVTKAVAVSDSDHIRGDKNAPITLIEYSDFECPYCARFFPTTEQVLAQYPGKVRLVYRQEPAAVARIQYEVLGESRKMHRGHGYGRQDLYDKIPSADRGNAILDGLDQIFQSAEIKIFQRLMRCSLIVNTGNHGARQGSRTLRNLKPTHRIFQALAVAIEHDRIRAQIVLKIDRLRVLQMSVSRHDKIRVTLGQTLEAVAHQNLYRSTNL